MARWAGIIEDAPEEGFIEVEAETKEEARELLLAAFLPAFLDDELTLADSLIVLRHAGEAGAEG